jgi:hypothetical protein
MPRHHPKGAVVSNALDAIETMKAALAETAASLDAGEKSLAARLDDLVEAARPATPTPRA